MKRRIATIAINVFAALILCHGATAVDYNDGARRAVTLWWVIFNNPDACVANPGGLEQCGSVDVFGAAFLESIANGAPDPSLIAPNPDVDLAVIYGTGGKSNMNGRVRLAAALYKTETGQPLNLPPSVDPMGGKRGLENPNAEIHLIIRDHGMRARGDNMIPQITAFLDPYCSDPNLLYFAGPNICQDVQFAVFAPTESGKDVVRSFADGAPVHKGKAFLLRDGDSVRAVVDTRL